MRFWTREDIGNELRAVNKLCIQATHPNIVSVLKYGTMSSDYYFMDMELCDVNLDMYLNHDLSPLLETNLPYFTIKVSPRIWMKQTLDIMESIIVGVEFIHSKNETHRDIKPRNGSSPVKARC